MAKTTSYTKQVSWKHKGKSVTVIWRFVAGFIVSRRIEWTGMQPSCEDVQFEKGLLSSYEKHMGYKWRV